MDSRHDCKAELGGRDERALDQRGVDSGKGEEPSERRRLVVCQTHEYHVRKEVGTTHEA